jgi:site-specific DNA-methyltransferase (adenine-specific)
VSYHLHHGDCLEVMRSLPAAHFDSIVTDPPYGLGDHRPDQVIECLRAWLAGEPYAIKGRGFMGKGWDAWVPGPEVFRACLRVLKPGGHLLAFAGTRSMDLMSMAIRLSGFELRDAIGHAHDGGGAPLLAWAYGSGFPKSLNVSRALDSRSDDDVQAGVPQPDVARQWQGWGTALKPAWEPVVLARKPLVGTVTENVLEHGTGALNINGCRIETEEQLRAGSGGIPCRHDEQTPRTRQGEPSADRRYDTAGSTNFAATPGPRGGDPAGRWPANLIHDGSDEVVALFPAEAGAQAPVRGTEPTANGFSGPVSFSGMIGRQSSTHTFRGDTGSAARFFYCAKASNADRNAGCDDLLTSIGGMVSNTSGQHITRRDEGYQPKAQANTHPTVKPTDLMRYLLRLVTPPCGVTLDPFAGSGSTGKAAILEGFEPTLIERETEYLPIIKARCDWAARERARLTAQGHLFPEVAA